MGWFFDYLLDRSLLLLAPLKLFILACTHYGFASFLFGAKSYLTDVKMTVQTLSLQNYLTPEHKAEFVEQLKESLSSTGFVRITDHGIDSNTLRQAYDLLKQLFDLPLNTKQRYALDQPGLRGYTGFGRERAKGQSAADLKEFWHIGKELASDSPYYARYPANLWPSELPEFTQLFKALFSKLEAIALQLLNAIGEGFDIEESYFPRLINDGNSVLRLIHYPAVEGLDTTNQMRAAAHADINLMTLLVGATDSGLQLLDKQGNWVDVTTKPDEIVVDTGDMMARITGHTLPSTIHRVINPDNSSSARYSMPFFLHPHSDAILEKLPQFHGDSEPAISAGDFLNQRLAENGLKR